MNVKRKLTVAPACPIPFTHGHGPTTTRHLGIVGVDSSRLCLTDPTYLGGPQWNGRLPVTATDIAVLPYQTGVAGLAIVFPTGGDGVYDVYGTYDRHDRLIAVEVRGLGGAS